MDQEIEHKQKDAYRIDRESYEPAYIQLANILRVQIAKGTFRPGDQLPSEAQLCQRFSISPMTVRRSINLLTDQGVVTTAQGRGTFVKALEVSKAVFDLQELQDFFKQGSTGSVKLLDVRVISTDERTARKLELETGAPVIYMRRMFIQEDQPVIYHRAYLVYDPTQPIVEAEMDATSLLGLFTSGSHKLLKWGELSIESTLMNEEEAALLKKSLPASAFYLEHLFFGFNNRPISWGWFIIPSERLHFTTRVGIKEV